MEMIKCNNGHYYDVERYGDICPHCNAGSGSGETYDMTMPISSFTSDGMTMPANSYSGDTDIPTFTLPSMSELDVTSPPEFTTDDEETKTVGFFKQAIGSEPVVGWLVCVEGNHLGEDFKLKAGKNFIGRTGGMDICLSGDQSVSREQHCAVLYDPRNNFFLVQPGSSRELSYLNDSVILNPVELKPYDAISVGESKLLFVPFCNDKFIWKSEKENAQA
ncbi:MAG: FHA domain-containing protein [Clostridia bacterium]|nr:FHA domain-containing protein [Clostridia bacterium]